VARARRQARRPLGGNEDVDQSADGLDAMKEFANQVHSAYPDMHIVADESYYLEDLAIVVRTLTGTNNGERAGRLQVS